MPDFFDLLAFSFSVTGPILFVLAMGVLLKRIGLITEGFIDVGSRLVFNVTLPILLFVTIGKTDFGQTANMQTIVVGAVGTLTVFVLMAIIVRFTVEDERDRGVVVQGGYRSNMGIVGLAYCVNAYGELGLAASSLYLGLITILYNVLAVGALNHYLHQHRSITKALSGIVRNPLILSIVAALPVSYFQWPLPQVVLQTGEYFAQMTLPLALLCTGGSLSFAAMRYETHNTLVGAIGKSMLSPLVIVLIAWAWGLRGMDLGIVFLMSAPPTATASFVMVRAMGGNGPLAANIIVMSTVGSIVFTSLGLLVLRGLGWM